VGGLERIDETFTGELLGHDAEAKVQSSKWVDGRRSHRDEEKPARQRCRSTLVRRGYLDVSFFEVGPETSSSYSFLVQDYT